MGNVTLDSSSGLGAPAFAARAPPAGPSRRGAKLPALADVHHEDLGAVPALPPHVILIFGAAGDLARRKLLPGLLRLFQPG